MWTTNFNDIVCDSITATTSTITTQIIEDLTATWNTIIWNAATDTATLNGKRAVPHPPLKLPVQTEKKLATTPAKLMYA